MQEESFTWDAEPPGFLAHSFTTDCNHVFFRLINFKVSLKKKECLSTFFFLRVDEHVAVCTE